MTAIMLAAQLALSVPACTTVQPSPAFVCHNGGWLPPGHPLLPPAPPEPPTALQCWYPDVMRPVLQNQPQIEARNGVPLVQALRNICAAIQTGWGKQHNGDGGHTTVVADSLTAPVVRSQGRCIGSRIWDVNDPAEADTMPLAPDATFTADGGQFFDILRIRTDSGGATIVHGLSAAGREEGEQIIIAVAGNLWATFKHLSSSTPDGTQFLITGSTDVASEITIASGGFIRAVYLRHPFFGKSYWWLESVRE